MTKLEARDGERCRYEHIYRRGSAIVAPYNSVPIIVNDWLILEAFMHLLVKPTGSLIVRETATPINLISRRDDSTSNPSKRLNMLRFAVRPRKRSSWPRVR